MTRSEPNLLEQNALRKMCPYCWAQPGQWCKRAGTQTPVVVLHAKRLGRAA